MLEMINRTVFATTLVPALDKDGYEYATIVIKGTYDIVNGIRTSVADEPLPIFLGAEYSGKPGYSSLKYESDTAMVKPGTDIVLNGSAYTRNGPKPSIDVGIKVGTTKKIVRVFGERTWCKSHGSWQASTPVPFEAMPLTYENAFGGADNSHPDPEQAESELRNPVGKGFASGKNEPLEDAPLPNLEDPSELIVNRKDHPAPVGFGFIDADWQPRKRYAGTYDEAWQHDRAPLLPTDFDKRFFNSAHEDLVTQSYLQGGEQVKVINASKDRDYFFDLPTPQFDVTVWIKGKPQDHRPNLDTVIVEPDEQRLQMVWRVAVPCFREFLYIDRILIR